MVKFRVLSLRVAQCAFFSIFLSITAWAQSCPITLPPPDLLGAARAPEDVCLPDPLPPGIPFVYFDDFSWRSFISLVWPAASRGRAKSDLSKTLDQKSDRLVFETYKADWETFQPGAVHPTAWDDFTPPSVCQNTMGVKLGDFVLASFSEFGNVGEAGLGKLVNVLVAQNRTYIRYLAAYNEVEFNYIIANEFYIASKAPAPGTGGPKLPAPNGAITIKSAWMDMTNVPHPERFYTRDAWIQNPKTFACKKTTVGLIGLHIVRKTSSRPQWIWSTFEHVDNVPEPDISQNSALTLNDGSGGKMPAFKDLAPDYKIGTAPESAPSPFNVERVRPISSSTATTNALWRAVLRTNNSVWQNYQLVMTQWPTPGNAPQNSGAPAFSVPPQGTATAFANTTMETFDQTSPTTGCMGCHNSARTADFVWSIPMQAQKQLPTPSANLNQRETLSPRADATELLETTLTEGRN